MLVGHGEITDRFEEGDVHDVPESLVREFIESDNFVTPSEEGEALPFPVPSSEPNGPPEEEPAPRRRRSG